MPFEALFYLPQQNDNDSKVSIKAF